MDTIEESAPIWCRHRYSAEFKAKTVQKYMQPGVSVAAIALYYCSNANLLWRWVAGREAKNGASEDRELVRVLQDKLIPLRIGKPTIAVPDIQTEVRHDATTISLRWSGSTIAQCAQWLQGWLR